MVPLKYLSIFWKTLKMPLINCKINLILAWFASCFITYASVENQVPTFAIADTELYVQVVTLSTQINANGNKYQSKVIMQEWKLYLDYLVDPSFQGANRLFVLSNTGQKNYKSKSSTSTSKGL